MTKELSFQIVVDGVPLQGTSHILVENGKVDYSSAEEHFYEIVRKWEKDWIKEANEEEKSNIVDNLTKEQETKLQEKHAKSYHGLDDEMSDDFENWLEELDLSDLKNLLK